MIEHKTNYIKMAVEFGKYCSKNQQDEDVSEYQGYIKSELKKGTDILTAKDSWNKKVLGRKIADFCADRQRTR